MYSTSTLRIDAAAPVLRAKKRSFVDRVPMHTALETADAPEDKASDAASAAAPTLKLSFSPVRSASAVRFQPDVPLSKPPFGTR